jgi:predicted site-specific integrase-resolvase
MENGTGYITRNEAAARAGVTVRTVTRWITQGYLTKVPGRRGRRAATLIDVAELDRLTATEPLRDDG